MFKTLIIVILAVVYGNISAQNFKIKKLKVNNELDHYGAVIHNNKLYFTSNLTTKRGKPILDRYSSNVYSIYETTLRDDGEIVDPQLVKKTRKEVFNFSGATFSKNGKYMYFTTNQVDIGDNKRKRMLTFNLQIQRAEYVEGKGWTNFTVLPFCEEDYNYGHPALDADDSHLYFISNRKGTKGRSDIYKVAILDDGKYGEIQRLDDTINSPRNEAFPFFDGHNTLYFSSNRKGGIGALDIYQSKRDKDGQLTTPKLLPKPVNSPGDDFSFFITDDLTKGYFSSRRYRGEGGDDLFYFTVE